ncbi:MAG TPA: hypothetical protein VKB38_14495 [Terracidiphilus sp.]|nr:hypothetical protein [Terracidiphilus sp.]
MDSEPGKTFEQVRAQIDAKQKAILWDDARKGGAAVDAFFWKGDPNARPIQRAGLIVFAMAFLLFSLAIASIPFEKHFEDGWSVDFLMAAGALAISARLIRNALRGNAKIKRREKG